MTTIDDAMLRGAQYAHEALDAALSIRRTTYVEPSFFADMSRMNAELDRILHDRDEPPC